MQKATPCHDDVFMMHAQKVWYRSQLVQYIIENNIWKFTQRISMETPCCFPRQSTNKTKQNKTIKLQGILSLLIWTTLKTDSFHDANFVVTGGTRVVVRQSQVPPVTAKLASWQLSCFREVTGEKTQIEVGGATVAREKTQTEFDGATVAREKHKWRSVVRQCHCKPGALYTSFTVKPVETCWRPGASSCWQGRSVETTWWPSLKTQKRNRKSKTARTEKLFLVFLTHQRHPLPRPWGARYCVSIVSTSIIHIIASPIESFRAVALPSSSVPSVSSSSSYHRHHYRNHHCRRCRHHHQWQQKQQQQQRNHHHHHHQQQQQQQQQQ